MNQRDLWLVGLLTLAYIYLDSGAPPPRRTALPVPPPRPQTDEHPLVRASAFADPEACPRDYSHPVSLRADGAKWCLACDEGFYPALTMT